MRDQIPYKESTQRLFWKTIRRYKNGIHKITLGGVNNASVRR